MQLKETFQRWCFLLSSWTFAPVFATSRNHFYFLSFPTCCWCEMMFSGRKQNCHFHSGLHYISALPVNLVRSLMTRQPQQDAAVRSGFRCTSCSSAFTRPSSFCRRRCNRLGPVVGFVQSQIRCFIFFYPDVSESSCDAADVFLEAKSSEYLKILQINPTGVEIVNKVSVIMFL